MQPETPTKADADLLALEAHYQQLEARGIARPPSPLHQAMIDAGWTDRQIGAAMDAAGAYG